MKLKDEIILFYSVIAFLVGAAYFMIGFFPLSYSSDERASFDDLPQHVDSYA